MEDRWAEMERRLERAERRARVTAALSLATLIAAVTLVAVRPGETQSRRSTLRAPFRVVDTRGKILLEVGARGGTRAPNDTALRLFHPGAGSESPAVELLSTPEGGWLDIRNKTQILAVLAPGK